LPTAPPAPAHPRRAPPDAPYGRSQRRTCSHEAPAPQLATATAVDRGRGVVGRAPTGRRRGPPRPGRHGAVGRGRCRRGQPAGRAPRPRRAGGCGPHRAACASSPPRPPRRAGAAPSSGLPSQSRSRRSALANPAPQPLARRQRQAAPPAAASLLAGAMDDGALGGAACTRPRWCLAACGGGGCYGATGGVLDHRGWAGRRRRGGEPRARDSSADEGGGLRATSTPVEGAGADAGDGCLWRHVFQLGSRRGTRAGGRGTALLLPLLAAGRSWEGGRTRRRRTRWDGRHGCASVFSPAAWPSPRVHCPRRGAATRKRCPWTRPSWHLVGTYFTRLSKRR